jgi:hypothetical protein
MREKSRVAGETACATTARVLLPGGEQAVFVPRSAVIRDKTTDSYQVYTIENGTAHLRVVVIVATNHQGELFDGASVEESQAKPPAPPRQ